MTISGPYHVNVNCSDLAVSLAFYRDALGFSPIVHTAPNVQPGAAFGFDAAQWDAWILAGTDPLTGEPSKTGVVLDLLEWRVPPPGTRLSNDGRPGFTHLVIAVPDPEAVVSQVAPGGADRQLADHGPAGHRIADPDGTPIELVEGEGVALVGVGIASVDTDATRDLLDGVLSSAADFITVAPATRRPQRAAANDLGPFRMAWLTDNIDADHATLLHAGLDELSGPVSLDMGLEGSDVSLLASFLTDANGCCFELIAPPT